MIQKRNTEMPVKLWKNQILENMIGHKRKKKDGLKMFQYISVVLEEGRNNICLHIGLSQKCIIIVHFLIFVPLRL